MVENGQDPNVSVKRERYRNDNTQENHVGEKFVGHCVVSPEAAFVADVIVDNAGIGEARESQSCGREPSQAAYDARRQAKQLLVMNSGKGNQVDTCSTCVPSDYIEDHFRLNLYTKIWYLGLMKTANL